MFSQKLDQIMKGTGTGDSTLAEAAGLDRTGISRFRTGSRVPKQNGSSAAKLVQGILLCARRNETMTQLCALCGADSEAEDAQIQNALHTWLFSDEPAKEMTETKKKKKLKSFSRKLDEVMTMLDLSNAKLGRLLYVDSSLISRYRKGTRIPQAGSPAAERICAQLWDLTMHYNRRDELGRIMHIAADEIDEDVFTVWLLESEDQYLPAIRSAQSLLEAVDRYRPPAAPSAFPAGFLPAAGNFEKKERYTGNEGLREAVLRFLSEAAQNHAGHLYLYSDQNMQWMTEDAGFFRQWSALMYLCAAGGTHITVIHNIAREPDEMISALKGWIPLYMTGMLESYYSLKQRDARFSHTFFLNPESSCIRAFHTAGAESHGLYNYITGTEELSQCVFEYQSLLQQARMLVRMNPSLSLPEASGCTLIQNTLSIATMPEELAAEFQSPQLYEYWKNMHVSFLELLRTGRITECMPLHENLHEQIPAEKLPGGTQLFYTPEQYRAHVQAIRSLQKENPDYRFIPLQQNTFDNIRILICGHFVQIIYTGDSPISFEVSHPLLVEAFHEYARRLIRQSSL